MANEMTHPEDHLPVRSRISWGAIFAGLFVAMAAYLVLGLLGAAIGLAFEERSSGDRMAVGATMWAVLTTVIALFLGGWTASQFTVGETRTEAAFYGLIVWGVLFTVLLHLSLSGVRMGFGAVMSSANLFANGRGGAGTSAAELEDAARRAGLDQAQIDRLRNSVPASAEDLRNAADSPASHRAATQATWWTLAGVVLSIFAAICGALAGAGHSPIMRPLLFRRTFTSVQARPSH
jgi:hypothetical protein